MKKNFYPKWGGGKISFMNPRGRGSQIWFPFPFLASECTPSPSFSFIFLIFDVPFPPPPPPKRKVCWYAKTANSLRKLMHTVTINAQAHTNALRLIQIETSMGSIFTRYWYFIEQNDMDWNQFWGWASQQAYVTRDQWVRTLTKIMTTEKHLRFRCMYIFWKFHFPFFYFTVSSFLFVLCWITFWKPFEIANVCEDLDGDGSIVCVGGGGRVQHYRLSVVGGSTSKYKLSRGGRRRNDRFTKKLPSIPFPHPPPQLMIMTGPLMSMTKFRLLIKDNQSEEFHENSCIYSIRFRIYGIRPIYILIANFVIGLRKGRWVQIKFSALLCRELIVCWLK